MDLNEAVCENVIKQSHSISNQDLFEFFVRHQHPEKVKLDVFLEVFTQFMEKCPPELLNQSTPFNLQSIFFNYDEKVWRGTINCELSPYGDQDVLFTNIKLPNDGFVTSDYCAEDDCDDLDENEVVDELVGGMLSRVGDFEPTQVKVNYKENEGRFEVYFFHDNGSKCLTIKVEYGTYEFFTNKKDYPLQRLKKFKKR